jgi:hypothetical protein
MNILYLSFYFEPDLCAGSFRNSPLAKELSKQGGENCHIEVVTTQPNRYSSFKVEAKEREDVGNMSIHRIDLPSHKSGMMDQVRSFSKYFTEALKITKGKHYDLVFASSSRLFTAYLGYVIARRQRIPLYLDIRDIFVDTMNNVMKNKLIKSLLIPFLKLIEKRTFNYATHINLISAGFKPYFSEFKSPSYSYFTNGIDDIFIGNISQPIRDNEGDFTITYAGNIGEGQGLHKIIPQAAAGLGSGYQFKVIGDGGAKSMLVSELKRLGVTNVELLPPMSRNELLEQYNNSDFLFLHLNDYEAFEKVLPSKIFELATFNKPVVAGVGGYANRFIYENVDNVILFQPCDADSMVTKIKNYEYKNVERQEFIRKFSRDNINQDMARSILSYL